MRNNENYLILQVESGFKVELSESGQVLKSELDLT